MLVIMAFGADSVLCCGALLRVPPRAVCVWFSIYLCMRDTSMCVSILFAFVPRNRLSSMVSVCSKRNAVPPHKSTPSMIIHKTHDAAIQITIALPRNTWFLSFNVASRRTNVNAPP